MAATCDGNALLARLAALFTEDPDIDEIGLLFEIEAADLTAETAFVLVEHKLGVAFSAGPLLFRAARARFHELNALLHADRIAESDDARDELLACTRAVVLISADFYTAWNTRKEYVRRGWLDASREITFTNLVFSLHPKSIDTWAYRRWLATRLLEEKHGDPAALQVFFQAQVALCGVLTERYARNYHAWSYRHWVVSRFSRQQLEEELVAMQKWCESHLTDHSGWNHRQHTIKCLLSSIASQSESEQQRKALLLDEFAFLSTIMARFPSHEALWCHRRFVTQSLMGTSVFDAQESSDTASQLLEITKENSSPSPNTEALSQAWRQVLETLVSDVTSGALRDVEMAWRCGSKFARRYALWVLERLPEHDLVTSIKAEMRSALKGDDGLLDHLWSAKEQ